MKKHLISYFLPALLLLLMISIGVMAQSEQKELVKGDAMPSFSLIRQNGAAFESADFVGKSVLVIYFYPKDESMVYTKEACSFRDSFNDFTKAGAKVVGINAVTVESHNNLRTIINYLLSY